MRTPIAGTIVLGTLLLASTSWAGEQSSVKQAALAKEAKITMEQAQKAALAKEAGKIKSKELEKEEGRLIYSFDIKMKDGLHEVNVDAMTGDVIDDKVESAADEAKEKAADAKKKSAPPNY
jgi:hypothetical protein